MQTKKEVRDDNDIPVARDQVYLPSISPLPNPCFLRVREVARARRGRGGARLHQLNKSRSGGGGGNTTTTRNKSTNIRFTAEFPELDSDEKKNGEQRHTGLEAEAEAEPQEEENKAPIAPPPLFLPLHRMMSSGRFAAVPVLLGAGANPNSRDICGVSALHMAAECGSTVAAAALLEAGADTTALRLDGFSPLHLAVVFNREGVVKLLLEAEMSSLEVADSYYGLTPLTWAVRRPQTPVCVLLGAGADIEARSPDGLTPLHWACRFNSAENVDLLLKAGADPIAEDDTGADAMSMIGLGDLPVNHNVPFIGHLVSQPQGLFALDASTEMIKSGIRSSLEKAIDDRMGLAVSPRQPACKRNPVR